MKQKCIEGMAISIGNYTIIKVAHKQPSSRGY